MTNFKDGKSAPGFNKSSGPVVEIDATGMNLAELLFSTVQEGEGIKSVKGPLLAAVEQQQHVRLKNLHTAQPGTDSALQTFFGFFTGDGSDSYTFRSPLGDAAVTLQRKDIQGAVISVDQPPAQADNGLSRSFQSRLDMLRPITPGK